MFKGFKRVGAALLATLMIGFVPVSAQDQSILQAPAPVVTDQPTVKPASDVFGGHLFGGEFARKSFTGFNPDYQIAIGDTVALSMWGGFSIAEEQIVDAQGNIFIPQVGPVSLAGVRNEDLNSVITDAVKGVFKRNVGVYATLNGAKPVQVLVTGFVTKAGVYAGQSSDSILYFLDRAGGIDDARGSFRKVRILRQGRVIGEADLYDFILKGHLPIMQMRNGDTIVVENLMNQVSVTGDARNSFRFEFAGDVKLNELLELAAPKAGATHVRINRGSRAKNEVEYLSLAEAQGVTLTGGDRVHVITDKLPGTMSVRVEGETRSAQEVVLPYGATLADLMAQVSLGDDAEPESIQLLRESVKKRQKEMLEAQLRALESSVLTARARTASESQLRKIEAELILKWLDRARQVEPRGQVTLAAARSYEDIRLEPGDVIRIPRKSNLLMIHGDVLFPNAVAFQPGVPVEDYIDQAGGFNQQLSAVRVLVLHRDGTFIKLKRSQFDDKDLGLRPGDEIFVLPRVQVKNFQFAKDIIEVFYQLALSAGVVLRL